MHYDEKKKKRLLQIMNMITEQNNLIKEVGQLAVEVQQISDDLKKNKDLI